MRRTILVAALAALMAMIPGPALAGGPPEVFTETGSGSATLPFPGCGGTTGVVSVDFRFRSHVTLFDDGTGVVSFADWGTFEFDPEVGRSSSGHYRNGTTAVITNNTIVETVVFAGASTFDDGTHAPFILRSHVTVANGEVRVDDFSVMCTPG